MSRAIACCLDPDADAGADPPPGDAGDPGGEPAALPDSVRRHLGRLLAEAYQRTEAAPDPALRFAGLLAGLDDAVRGASEGRDAAFRAELMTHLPALSRYAVSLTHDRTAADDLVQDALVRVWRGRAGFMPGTNMEAWAFTILRNQFYSDRRKLGREVQDEEGAHAARLTTLPDQTDRLDLTDVRAALTRLPPEMREALMLVAVQNLSYEEVAALQGCRIGTVKSRVWRARDRLAKVLGYDGAAIGQDAITLSASGEAP